MSFGQLGQDLCGRHVVVVLLVELPQQVEHGKVVGVMARPSGQEVLKEGVLFHRQ